MEESIVHSQIHHFITEAYSDDEVIYIVTDLGLSTKKKIKIRLI